MKKWRKLLSLSIVLSSLLSFSLSSKAFDNVQSEIPASISNLAKILGLDTLSEVRPLYAPDEALIAYCADGDDEYLIYDLEGEVIEYSDCTSSRYSKISDSKIVYYGGPLSYYIKDDNDFVDLTSSQVLTIDDFYSTDEVNNQLLQNEGSIVQTQLFSNVSTQANDSSPTDIRNYVDGELEPLKYNNDGSCGQLAAAIELLYLEASYAIGVNSYLFRNPYYFYCDLKNVIPHASGSYGTTYSQLTNGINTYASKNKLSVSASYTKSSFFAKYKTNILNDIPSIIGLTGHSRYGDHWVVGYGTREVYYQGNLASQGFIVNDGWGSNNIIIALNQYVDGVIFVQPK